ncbi:unnamed protein product, partial [Adineta ricciae]
MLFYIFSQVNSADVCDNRFNAFLNSWAQNISSDEYIRSVETEFRDDYQTLVHQCFAKTSDDPNKCVLSDNELNGDVYGDDGPLMGCGQCQKIVKQLRANYLKINYTTRKCIDINLFNIVSSQLQSCTRNKLNDSDFIFTNQESLAHSVPLEIINIAEQAMSNRIMANSRLDACKIRNPEKWAMTNLCMKNGRSDMYHTQCIIQKASKISNVPTKCNKRFKDVKQATCNCIAEVREDWRNEIMNIKYSIVNALKDHKCPTDIEQIGNWIRHYNLVSMQCLGKDSQAAIMKTITTWCNENISKDNSGISQCRHLLFQQLFLLTVQTRITTILQCTTQFTSQIDMSH